MRIDVVSIFPEYLAPLSLSLAGTAIFLLVAAALRSPELEQLRRLLRRRGGRSAA